MRFGSSLSRRLHPCEGRWPAGRTAVAASTKQKKEVCSNCLTQQELLTSMSLFNNASSLVTFLIFPVLKLVAIACKISNSFEAAFIIHDNTTGRCLGKAKKTCKRVFLQRKPEAKLEIMSCLLESEQTYTFWNVQIFKHRTQKLISHLDNLFQGVLRVIYRQHVPDFWPTVGNVLNDTARESWFHLEAKIENTESFESVWFFALMNPCTNVSIIDLITCS